MILLCANGYSETGIQVLRGLFEKTITLLYLNKHPEEIERFINYSWIDRKKELNRIAPTLTRFGTQPRKETEDEIKQKADKLKDEFKGGKWGTKNTVEMAEDVGISQGFIHLGYYQGLARAHAKLISILRRIEMDSDGTLWWKHEIPPLEESGWPLMMGHWFLLRALEALCEYFKVEIPEEIKKQCLTDFIESYGLPGPEEKEDG